MQTGLLKLITQPVAGLTLFTPIAASSPLSAQLSKLPHGISFQQQTGYILGRCDRTQDLAKRDGDTKCIPTATNTNLEKTPQLATNPNQARTNAVVGVKRPSFYILSGTATDWAGINGDAEQFFNVNWQLIQAGNISQNAIFPEADTVIVAKATELPVAEIVELATARSSPDTINLSVIREVETSETIKVTPNTTLNQALTDGGFKSSRVQPSHLDLIRLNLDGISKQQVPINLAKSVNEQSNPILQENDIIVVRLGLLPA